MYNDFYDLNNLTINELKCRLILLEVEFDNEGQPKQYYIDLVLKCLTQSPANIKIIKKYDQLREINDPALSKKRRRDENEQVNDSIAIKDNSCYLKRLSSYEKKFTVRQGNNFPNLNYPTTDFIIGAAHDVILEVEEKPEVSANPKDLFRKSLSFVSPNTHLKLNENLNTPSNFQRANSFTPGIKTPFEIPRSVQSNNRVKSSVKKKSLNQCSNCVTKREIIQNHAKTVNTLNVKNLVGVVGLAGLSTFGYCYYKENEEVLELINSITNLINSKGFVIFSLAIAGFITFVLILKKMKLIMDKKFENVARKIISEAQRKLASLRSEGLGNSVECEAFVEEYCRQNKIWIIRRYIMNEITRILKNNGERLEEKVSMKTWVLK
jgi:predicted RNA-binding protein associated with RNAse of E/G family